MISMAPFFTWCGVGGWPASVTSQWLVRIDANCSCDDQRVSRRASVVEKKHCEHTELHARSELMG
jgi:hypothetical protein